MAPESRNPVPYGTSAKVEIHKLKEASYTVHLYELHDGVTTLRVYGPYRFVSVLDERDDDELVKLTHERDDLAREVEELQAGYDAIEAELTELRAPRNRRTRGDQF